MGSEMVEKVARATYEARPYGDEDAGDLTWANLENDWKERHRDMARAAIKAMGSEWKPIETAPKDGTNIIVAAKRGAVVIVGEAYFTERDDSSDTGWWWAGTSPGDYHAETILLNGWTPIAWQPLPEPPLPEFDGTEGDLYGHPIPEQEGEGRG